MADGRICAEIWNRRNTSFTPASLSYRGAAMRCQSAANDCTRNHPANHRSDVPVVMTVVVACVVFYIVGWINFQV
jgi:hypothetical protein